MKLSSLYEKVQTTLKFGKSSQKPRKKYSASGEDLNTYCPICEKYYSKFKSVAAMTSRDNAICPGCGGYERHRLNWPLIKSYFR